MIRHIWWDWIFWPIYAGNEFWTHWTTVMHYELEWFCSLLKNCMGSLGKIPFFIGYNKFNMVKVKYFLGNCHFQLSITSISNHRKNNYNLLVFHEIRFFFSEIICYFDRPFTPLIFISQIFMSWSANSRIHRNVQTLIFFLYRSQKKNIAPCCQFQ